MFSDEAQEWSSGGMTYLTRDEAELNYATKAEIPSISGGLDVGTADSRYAPITGSTQYATPAQIPDVSGKANTSDVTSALAGVATALSGKSDTNHTHTGTYQPVGDYATVSQIPNISGKANISDVQLALDGKQNVGAYLVAADIEGKADSSDVALALADKAPITGSLVYATKAELSASGGGDLMQSVADTLYAPITGSTTYATVAQIPDVSGKANTSDVTTALALKADQTTTYTKTEVDTALSTKQPTGSYAPATGSTVYQTTANMQGSGATYYSTTWVDTNVYTKTETNSRLNDKFDKADVAVAANNTDAKCFSAKYTNTLLTGKADQATTYNKTEVDTALTAKAPATGSTVYQTQANMVKVGSETTYYSGAKVDALLSTVGGGSAPGFLKLNGPTINYGYRVDCGAFVRDPTSTITDIEVSPNGDNVVWNKSSFAYLVRVTATIRYVTSGAARYFNVKRGNWSGMHLGFNVPGVQPFQIGQDYPGLTLVDEIAATKETDPWNTKHVLSINFTRQLAPNDFFICAGEAHGYSDATATIELIAFKL
jgi:hypothetical protein